jgi:hypothetical protein
MKNKSILILITLLFSYKAWSQGCVAIRNLAGFGQFAQLGYSQNGEKWMLDFTNRIFEAHTFLMGTQNITPPNSDDGIYLNEYALNMQLSRAFENGWSVNFDLPVLANSVISRIEHPAGDGQHKTSAFGIGDIRFTVYKWLFSNKWSNKGNIQLGLGIKFPTGNYHSTDYFYDNPAKPTEGTIAPVNVAIQLGDGGTGITTELNAFYLFNNTIGLYANFFYLISPVNVNGVSNQLPGYPEDPVAVATNSTVNSVPDSYTLRAGANFTFNNWVATAGVRYEGAPAHDLIGRSDGLRRVGHIFSVEPGVQYKFPKSFIYTFVTIPVARATIQTVPDKEATQITGIYTITPGHFADYVFFIGYAFTF